jgi:ribosomal protein S18 acetylase RimI-like enzyme
MPLYPATEAELPAVVAFVNAAYRGETSRQGWSTEADYLDGQRIDLALLQAVLAARPGGMLLLLRETAKAPLLGCVWLEPAEEAIWLLAMLTIRPDLQDRGYGRILLAEAENAVRERGGCCVQMTVLNMREALIAWYARRGYALTGATKPFPYGDERFGIPRRDDLCFVVMEKTL